MFKRVALFFVLFSYLIPMSVQKISLFWVSFAISLIYFIFQYRSFNKKTYQCLLSFLILLFINIITQFINESFELYVLKITIIGIVLFLNAYFIFLMYESYYGKDVEFSMIKDIVLCAFINSFFAISLTISGSLRSFLFSIVDTNPVNAHHLALGIRSSGLFYFGGSILSVFNFIALYLVAVVLSRFKLNAMARFFYIFVFVVITGGLFLAGRFGIILLLAGCLFVVLFPLRTHHVNKKIVWFGLISNILLMFFLFITFYDAILPILNRSLEVFINLYKGDGATSDSTDVLSTMYVFPNNIIFGDGTFGRDPDVPYIHSDVGYILMSFYSGVIGVLVYLLHFSFIYVVSYTSRKKVFFSFNIFVLCLFCMFIGNFKDVYFYGSQGVTQLSLIFLVLCCCLKNNTEPLVSYIK